MQPTGEAPAERWWAPVKSVLGFTSDHVVCLCPALLAEMTRKNKSARRAVAAAAATAAAAARAAPDESGAQDSPAQQPTSPLRLPTLVPEAAPPPPPHPGSPASNAAGREQLARSISDYIQAVNALTPAEAALQDMPAFQFAAVKLAQSHLNTDTQLSAEHVGAALDELDASAWAKSLKPGTDDGALDIAYEELLRACVPSGKDSAAGALAWVIGIMRQNPIILECEVRAMVARGEDFKAFPKLCELAFLTFLQWGPDHPYTVREVYRVTESLFQRAEIRSALVTWLLPRAVEHWGIGHPDTLRLVQHSAIHLYKCKDPRDLAEFARVVTEIAQQLPGGLGWGSAIVAPVPDEERFNSYVFMSFKAIEAKGQGHYRLAQDMLNRCVAYFDTLGAHWLGTPRKLQCMRTLADCVDDLEGFSASEPLLMQAKRTAQRELGATHEATLDIMW